MVIQGCLRLFGDGLNVGVHLYAKLLHGKIYSGGILNDRNGVGVGVLVQQTGEKLKGNTQWKQGERPNASAVFHSFIIIIKSKKKKSL